MTVLIFKVHKIKVKLFLQQQKNKLQTNRPGKSKNKNCFSTQQFANLLHD